MDIIKVHFGAEPETLCDYRKQADGFAEVWLYDNVQPDEEGWVADGVFLRTMQTMEQVQESKPLYFHQEQVVTADQRIEEVQATADMAYINSELALAMLEMEV